MVENPRRRRPSTFKPRSSALSPATIIYFGTSCETFEHINEVIFGNLKRQLEKVLKRHSSQIHDSADFQIELKNITLYLGLKAVRVKIFFCKTL